MKITDETLEALDAEFVRIGGYSDHDAFADDFGGDYPQFVDASFEPYGREDLRDDLVYLVGAAGGSPWSFEPAEARNALAQCVEVSTEEGWVQVWDALRAVAVETEL